MDTKGRCHVNSLLCRSREKIKIGDIGINMLFKTMGADEIAWEERREKKALSL